METGQGFTDTYNLLKDSACRDKQVEELRELHQEVDSVVLSAYGWTSIRVPTYADPASETDRIALVSFEDSVIDRLFVLNAAALRSPALELIGWSSS